MPVPKPLNDMTIDEDNSDADEVHSDKVGGRTDSDPTFEQRGPSSKPRFTTQAHLNRLTPNDPYMGRTAPLTSKRCILYIY
jgi:hypothetical protein